MDFRSPYLMIRWYFIPWLYHDFSNHSPRFGCVGYFWFFSMTLLWKTDTFNSFLLLKDFHKINSKVLNEGVKGQKHFWRCAIYWRKKKPSFWESAVPCPESWQTKVMDRECTWWIQHLVAKLDICYNNNLIYEVSVQCQALCYEVFTSITLIPPYH